MRRLAVDALLFGSDLAAFAAAGYLAARGRVIALALPGGIPLPEAAADAEIALAGTPGDADLLPRSELVTREECAAGRVGSAALLERAAALLARADLPSAHGAVPLKAAREGTRVRSASFATPRFPFKARARLFADFTGALSRAAGAPAHAGEGREARRLLHGPRAEAAAHPAAPRPDRLLDSGREALAACRLARAARPAGPAPPSELAFVDAPRGRARYGAALPGASARLAFGGAPGDPGALPFALEPHRAEGLRNLYLFGLAADAEPAARGRLAAPRDRLLSGLLAGAALDLLLALRRDDPPLTTADVEARLLASGS